MIKYKIDRRKTVIIIWLAVNLILAIKYYWDAVNIQCEPCLPGIKCPPCQTSFMANFWEYFSIINIVMFLIMVVLGRKKQKATAGLLN